MKILQDTYADGFFDVSASHGFLPSTTPLAELPETYRPLQELLDQMPVVKEDGTGGYLHYPGQIHAAAAQLPNFIEQVTAEKDIRVIQALYRGYAFLTSAYTLEPAFQHFRETGKYGKANNVLPANIAQPFVTVCNIPLARLPLWIFVGELQKN
jgi:indoleamine 2,3-dioxygenase